MLDSPIKNFITYNFRHFNAATLVEAAKAYERHISNGGKMMVTIAGAMSTAEIGISLAEMIRKDRVHIISCTGANLEEDLTNLIAHSHYKAVPNYRELSPNDEWNLMNSGYNRVTDTCIPEEDAFNRLYKNERLLPHEFIYKMILSGDIKKYYEIDPKESWMIAAAEKNLPIICPGWEDSTLGNIFALNCIRGELSPNIIKNGIEYMIWLSDWYRKNCSGKGVGFFKIWGGIAGYFPICVVPMLFDQPWHEVPCWSYFCQISDSTTSYGSYSGAVPNEKISWGKLNIDTPKFIIESDATIVVPLVFAYVLGW
jgi:deoxyhypusine synthase